MQTFPVTPSSIPGRLLGRRLLYRRFPQLRGFWVEEPCLLFGYVLGLKKLLPQQLSVGDFFVRSANPLMATTHDGRGVVQAAGRIEVFLLHDVPASDVIVWIDWRDGRAGELVVEFRDANRRDVGGQHTVDTAIGGAATIGYHDDPLVRSIVVRNEDRNSPDEFLMAKICLQPG